MSGWRHGEGVTLNYEERERMRERATRWHGLTVAADVLRLLQVVEQESDGL